MLTLYKGVGYAKFSHKNKRSASLKGLFLKNTKYNGCKKGKEKQATDVLDDIKKYRIRIYE